MCYIVQQETGKLAELAGEYESIRINGSLASAIAFFDKQGFNVETSKDPLNVWWVYDAAIWIKGQYNVSYGDAENWIKSRGLKDADQNYAIAVCSIAAEEQGGTWKYYYQY